MNQRALYRAIRFALFDRHAGAFLSSPIAANVIYRWMSAALLIVLLAGCGLVPRVVSKPVSLQITHEVREPIPAHLLQPNVVTEPDAACWDDTQRVFCNRQLAGMRLDYRSALLQCNADKASARAFDAQANGAGQ